MRLSIKKGFNFGLTSGIITTLGLMIGLYSTTNSKLAVMGGILVIAIADALSDALGMHISEESGRKTTTTREVWESTISTFLSKLVFALTFIVPVLIFNLFTAIIVSIIWGSLLLCIVSCEIAKKHRVKRWKVITEHILITAVVIVISYYVGYFVKIYFG